MNLSNAINQMPGAESASKRRGVPHSSPLHRVFLSGGRAMKELTIGDNYGSIFGLDAAKCQKMIYLGGSKWRAEKPGLAKEMDSPDTSAKALAYINGPVVHMSATI